MKKCISCTYCLSFVFSRSLAEYLPLLIKLLLYVFAAGKPVKMFGGSVSLACFFGIAFRNPKGSLSEKIDMESRENKSLIIDPES